MNVAILGARGGSRDVADIFEACIAAGQRYNLLGFVVDAEYGTPGTMINGYPVLGGYDWLEAHRAEVRVICGVGAPEKRMLLIERARALGVGFCTVIHPSVILTRRVQIGEGVSIGAGCVLTNQIRIGDHVQINIACTISHDALIGDYTTLSPGVHVAGNVTLGEGCFVGIGANIIDKKTVGAWSIIGAGAAVISDLPANVTAVGVPARVIKTRAEGWHRA